MIEELKKFFSEFEAEVIEFNPKNAKIDRRARWKCKFGCSYYGKRFSCPPNVPEDYEEFVRSYKKGTPSSSDLTTTSKIKEKLRRSSLSSREVCLTDTLSLSFYSPEVAIFVTSAAIQIARGRKTLDRPFLQLA